MRNRAMACVAALAALLCARCTSDLSLAGVGGQTTNGIIVGTLRSENGIPAEKAAVRLIPADFNPVADYASFNSVCKTDTTDLNGGFSFGNVAPGSYSVEAVRLTDRKRTLLRVSAHEKQTDTAPTGILRNPGVLKIVIPADADPVNGYLYIPGTTISALLSDVSGYLVIDSVPAGVIPSINYGVLNSSTRSIIRYAVSVPSGDVAVVSLPAWKYAGQLVLNTTASGADVAGTVYGFPVLVRLSSANFSFSQAKNDGGDLRFAKKNGTPLPFEIELWDSAGGLAAVWVKVDTIHGDNDSQSIVMVWGNPNASTASSGSAVFDTAEGFQGVWHLGEAGNASAWDATANRYHGTPFNMGPASAVPGAIGACRSFGGDSSFFIMTGTAEGRLNFPKDGYYTLSAWAYTDSIDGRTHAIADKGDNQYNLEQWYYDKWQFSEFRDKTGWETTSYPMVEKTWTYLSGVRNGNKQYLYVNGLCVDSVIVLNAYDLESRYTGFDFMIGRTKCLEQSQRDYYFKGKIDEVRAANTARSTDWVKLCYMNQKSTDALVRHK